MHITVCYVDDDVEDVGAYMCSKLFNCCQLLSIAPCCLHTHTGTLTETRINIYYI